MNHGYKAEDTLEGICHRLFGCDFVLRSPSLIDPSGTTELADFFVLVDDVAIIFQSKSLSCDVTELDGTKFGRVRKKYEHAKMQLNTALNAHDRGAEVRAVTPLDVAFTVDWSVIQKRIGIVTLNVNDRAYEDPEFRFQFPQLVEKHRGIMVHTFILADLTRMLDELSTPADVLLYLTTREKAFGCGRVIIGNELDLLAFSKVDYPQLDKAFSDPSSHIMVTPGFWEDYRSVHDERIREREDRFRSIGVIDRLIREMHTAVDFSAEQYGLTPQQSAVHYLSLIGKLGKLTRMERTEISQKVLEKVEKTKHDKWGYFVYASDLADTAFLFLLLNEDDREKRKAFLENLCLEACHLVPTSRLLGIATEGAQSPGRSTDAMLFDVPEVRREVPVDEFKFFKKLEIKSITEWGPQQ